MKPLLIFLTLLIVSLNVSAKKNLIEEKDEVIALAIEEITASLKPEGAMYLWAKENNISGTYTMDITIHERGKVATVFCSSKENANIPSQNKLKDYLMVFEFSFKTPKGRDYKFQYTFTF